MSKIGRPKSHNYPLTSEEKLVVYWLDRHPEIFEVRDWDEFATLFQYVDHSNSSEIPVRLHELISKYKIHYDQAHGELKWKPA